MTSEETMKIVLKACNDQLTSGEDCFEFYKDVLIALDKQIPMKPTGRAERAEEVGKIGHNNCPICGHLVSGRHCSYCGQRIQWEDNDEKL